MKKFQSGLIVITLALMILSFFAGCRDSYNVSSTNGSGDQNQTPDIAAEQSLDELQTDLDSLNNPDDPDNVSLQAEIGARLVALDIHDDSIIDKLSDFLADSAASANNPDTALSDFSELLSELALPGEPDNPAADNTATYGKIVVSDGFTRSGMNGTSDEILPRAVVYNMPSSYKNSVVNYLFATRKKGVAVQFYYRRTHLGALAQWHRLGNPVTTDSNGAASLSSLSPLLDSSCFPGKYQTERDLQLKAVASLPKGTISDNLGRIRILGADPVQNRPAILCDHDNTLHRTGGMNTLDDIADCANLTKAKWPLMESTVQASVKGWIAAGNDLIIITGQTDPVRPKCREQVGLHFEKSGERRILMINSSDVAISGSINDFKAAAIEIILGLYGETNIEAMVGDTVSQDGYGAMANGVTYIPYHVNCYLNPLALDTQGYGKIPSGSVLWNWDKVIDTVVAGMDSEIAEAVSQ